MYRIVSVKRWLPAAAVALVAAVLLVARFTQGLYYGLAASVFATFAFNYFFTDPRFTFAVNDTNYLIHDFIA